MRNRIARIAVVALACLLVPEVVMAAPADLRRQPDLRLRACASPSTCLIRAVADFDGDGRDDLLIQELPTAATRGGHVTDGPRLGIYFGTIAGARPSGQPRPSDPPGAIVTLRVPGVDLPFIGVDDLDADGRADLFFGSGALHGSEVEEVLHVVFGRERWPNTVSTADLRFLRRYRAPVDHPRVLAATLIQARFGDLDGDGRLDLVLGSDGILSAGGAHRIVPEPRHSHISVMYDALAGLALGNRSTGQRVDFREDYRFAGFGDCEGVLAGLADLSGNGRAEILARRCPGGGMPDQLEVLTSPVVASQRAEPEAEMPPVELDLTASKAFEALSSEALEVPPPTGGGYLSGLQSRDPMFGVHRPIALTDLDGDGIADIVLPMGTNTHIWRGGPDIAERVAQRRSDRVIVGAGFGMAMFSQSWQPAELGGQSDPGLLLSPLRSDDSLRPPAAASGVPELERFALPEARLYRGGWQDLRVLDLRRLAADAIWDGRATQGQPNQHLWAMGDFNGDGLTDMVLGGGQLNAVERFDIVFGPF